MPHVHKTIFLPYTPEQMYALVERVENYPQFLPWCGGVVVHARTETTLEATVRMSFKGFEQAFRTSNQNTPPTQMVMRFKDGPFRHLFGTWRFDASPHGVQVTFDLQYEFSNKLLALAIGPVFHVIAQTFMDGFVRRARVVYG